MVQINAFVSKAEEMSQLLAASMLTIFSILALGWFMHRQLAHWPTFGTVK
jgi:ABC-type glycerol-3-phosphate transport system permease component